METKQLPQVSLQTIEKAITSAQQKATLLRKMHEAELSRVVELQNLKARYLAKQATSIATTGQKTFPTLPYNVSDIEPNVIYVLTNFQTGKLQLSGMASYCKWEHDESSNLLTFVFAKEVNKKRDQLSRHEQVAKTFTYEALQTKLSEAFEWSRGLTNKGKERSFERKKKEALDVLSLLEND